MKTKSPETSGVEKTQPFVSNCHKISLEIAGVVCTKRDVKKAAAIKKLRSRPPFLEALKCNEFIIAHLLELIRLTACSLVPPLWTLLTVVKRFEIGFVFFKNHLALNLQRRSQLAAFNGEILRNNAKLLQRFV